MVEASSLGLADSLTQDERSVDLLYPRIERSKRNHIQWFHCSDQLLICSS